MHHGVTGGVREGVFRLSTASYTLRVRQHDKSEPSNRRGPHLAVARCCQLRQGPIVHYQNKSDSPPGVIGQRQLQRGGPLPGYFQPVEITSPAGTLVSVVCNGAFSEPKPAKLTAGMLIGQVYRLKVANLRNHEGQEVFPTIEVIDRLYPPPGQVVRFPIPIQLTEEELRYALDGRYVLRADSKMFNLLGAAKSLASSGSRKFRPVTMRCKRLTSWALPDGHLADGFAGAAGGRRSRAIPVSTAAGADVRPAAGDRPQNRSGAAARNADADGQAIAEL